MPRKTSDYKRILKLLDELHIDYPHANLGRHLELALGDLRNLEMVSDRELLNFLQKYQEELTYDGFGLMDEAYVDRIKQDAEHLFDEIDGYEETD